MIVAPAGYEWLPIPVNPLIVPEMASPAPPAERQDIPPLGAASAAHLDSRPHVAKHRRDTGESPGDARSTPPSRPPIVPDVLAGGVASDNSAVLIAARTEHAAVPSTAVKAYEHPAPAFAARSPARSP